MKKVYLDYSATTPVKDEVLDAMIPYFKDNFGNPSSLYTIGLESKDAVTQARAQIASLINAEPSEIYFTAGGSEADNWTLVGIAEKMEKKGKHIITSMIEHPAILRTCEYLETRGFEVTYLQPEESGIILPEALENAIREDTILISIMAVNNEIGTVEPIKELSEVAKKHGILFHTDAVQALGNIPLDVKADGIDLMSLSSHKIYGPKGVGALYIRKGVEIKSFIHGGGQENNKRAGTENLPAIIGFGKAAELAKKNFKEHVKHCSELRDYLVREILETIPYTNVNGTMEYRHPGNANITFEYIEGESILLLLDMHGIAISTGSACSSKSLKPSHVLDAIKVPVELIHGSVRFTVGDFTTKEDIDYVVNCLKDVVTTLRKMSPISAEKGW